MGNIISFNGRIPLVLEVGRQSVRDCKPPPKLLIVPVHSCAISTPRGEYSPAAISEHRTYHTLIIHIAIYRRLGAKGSYLTLVRVADRIL